MTTYGPYLRYLGTVFGGGGEDANVDVGDVDVDVGDGKAVYWTGSALMVVPLSEPRVRMTLLRTEGGDSDSDPPPVAAIVVEAEPIHSTPTHEFRRYSLRIRLMPDRSQRFRYGFPDVRPGFVWSFYVPSSSDPYWRCCFNSCNGFTGDVTDETREKMGGESPLWKDLLKRHAEDPYYVMIGGGDQIYCDEVWDCDGLKSWLKIHGRDNRRNAEWTRETDAQVDAFYFANYCDHFAKDGIREAYAMIPQVNVCDDHDCFDGFGSFPEYLEKSNVFQNLRRIGYKYFLLFQLHTSPDEDRSAGGFVKGGISYSILTYLGRNFSALLLDTRHHRTRERIVTQEEYDACFAAIERLPPSTRHLLVVIGVPIIYPRLSGEEFGLHLVGETKKVTNKIYNSGTKYMGKGIGKVFGEKSQKGFVDTTTKIKLKMGKSGLMSKVLNDFGEVSLDDDVIDHWANKFHGKERESFIARLAIVALKQSLRVTFIAGDVHCAAVGRIYNPQSEFDHRLMYQVISSAIVNAPPPPLVLKKVHFNCRNNNAHPTTYGPFDPVKVNEEMVAVFDRDVDGTKPKAGHKLLGRRNWCSIQNWGGEVNSNALEFVIMVEAVDHWEDAVPYRVRVPPTVLKTP